MSSLKRLGSRRSLRASFSSPALTREDSSSRRKTSRMSWCGTPSSRNAQVVVTKSTSMGSCDPPQMDQDIVGWEEGKAFEVEAHEYLSRMTKETQFFDQEREDALPRFDLKEVVRGTLLGRGGFSAVHEVKSLSLEPSEDNMSDDAKDDRRVMSRMCIRNGDARYAMKKVAVDGRREPQRYMKGLLDLAIEMKFLSVMEHPHLIKIRAVSTAEPCTGNYFILLDRLYDTLGQRIVSWKRQSWKALSMKKKLFGGLKINDTLTATRLIAALDIGSALLHMHANSIIYRDLKPENVGFDVRDDVKVFDLGLAKEVHPHEAHKDGTYHLTGMTGSLRYMAPEVAVKKPYNSSADVYSFGILLWQILSMDIPFKGLNVQLHHELVIGKGIRPDLPAKWPQGWKTLVRKCWAGKLADRPPMERVLDDLRSSLSTMHGSSEDFGMDVSARTNKSIEQLFMSGRSNKSIDQSSPHVGGLSSFIAKSTTAIGMQN